MYSAFVLIKNLTSNSRELRFSEFKLCEIQHGDMDALARAHELFSKGVPLYGDWVYERCYRDTTANHLEKILYDIEDTLFLLRLFKVGDLVFIRPCIKEQDGNLMRQLPYRIMSDIPAFHKYELQPSECSQFDEFATEMISQNNWTSTWFKTARRFFLYGSSKEFNPTHNEVDRIVDYMIVMESILVPENDFVNRRLRERVVPLLKSLNMDLNDTKRLLRDFYEVRSRIVHGGDVSSFKNGILDKSIEFKFEKIVREVIKEALKALPEDANREEFLKSLFDVGDQHRADKVLNDFCAIKDANEKKRCFDLIAKLL